MFTRIALQTERKRTNGTAQIRAVNDSNVSAGKRQPMPKVSRFRGSLRKNRKACGPLKEATPGSDFSLGGPRRTLDPRSPRGLVLARGFDAEELPSPEHQRQQSNR